MRFQDCFSLQYSSFLTPEEFDYELRNGIQLQRYARQLTDGQLSAEDFLEIADYLLPEKIDQYMDEACESLEFLCRQIP